MVLEILKRIVLVVVPLVLAFVLNRRFNTKWIEVEPIAQRHFERHPTRGAYGSKDQAKMPRVYLLCGGSGFVGSWIARYLLSRGEKNVHIIDRLRPAGDLLKHGAVFHEADLADASAVEPLVRRIAERAHTRTRAIVYNCCVVKRYWAPNFLTDLGVTASETFLVALRHFQKDQAVVIHLGDALAHRQPVRNWHRVWPTRELWCQLSADDSDVPVERGEGDSAREAERDRAFSSYAWHQLALERPTLQLPALNHSVGASAVLRVDGLVSGHVGDGMLEPCIKNNGAVLHSPNVPLTIVHVEDVARAALSLEHALLDPSTAAQFSGKQFTVGSSEVTTMHDVLAYVQKRRPSMYIARVEPVIVFLITSFVAILSPLMRVQLKPSRTESMFRSRPHTLTYPRFYTLQVAQLPNKGNLARQHEVLAVHNNFSLSDTLDMICNEVAVLEEQAREAAADAK